MDEVRMHERLRNYLRGRVERKALSVEREKKSVESGEWRVESKAFEGLLELVDQVKDGVEIPESEKEVEVPRTFDDIDTLLGELYVGNASMEDKKSFLSGLYYSENFYQRVLMKIGNFSSVLDGVIPEEMAKVEIKSDNQILNEIGISISKISKVESVNAMGNKFQEWAEKLFGWLFPNPRYAYVMVILVLGLIIVIPGTMVVYYTTVDERSENIYGAYIYNEHVPYVYQESKLRGSDTSEDKDQLLQQFDNQFKIGISKYIICNYVMAIEIFTSLESEAYAILNHSNVKDRLWLLRDYYFYFGLSCFAESRNHSMTQKMNNEYLSQSIHLLSEAKSIAEKNDFPEQDRETFFLGIALVFNHENELAIHTLNTISVESNYYIRAKKLIKELSTD